jgi:hypothetical protein
MVHFILMENDAPPNSLKDLDVNLKVKIMEEKRVSFLACSTLGAKGVC